MYRDFSDRLLVIVADWETLAYTSIMPAGPYSAWVVYQKYSTPKWGSTSASYMMQIEALSPAPRVKYGS